MFGRYQPWHQGHQWLLDELLSAKDLGVWIGVRDCPISESNPNHAVDVVENIRSWIYSNRPKDTHRIYVSKIPDIEGVHYGRGVGWNIQEHTPPEDIKQISATKIRENNAKNISTPSTLGPLFDGIEPSNKLSNGRG